MKDWIPLLIAIVSSQALGIIINHFLNRPRKKDIAASVSKLEVEMCRVQLLVMMDIDPKNYSELFKIGYKYFVELKQDEYITGIYKSWLDKENLQYPEWFHPDH